MAEEVHARHCGGGAFSAEACAAGRCGAAGGVTGVRVEHTPQETMGQTGCEFVKLRHLGVEEVGGHGMREEGTVGGMLGRIGGVDHIRAAALLIDPGTPGGGGGVKLFDGTGVVELGVIIVVPGGVGGAHRRDWGGAC